MRNFFILSFLILCSCLTFGQTYIQVTGEPDLSVYLNNQLKGKTTAEYNGYIIENVTAGKNVIKIVKEGFTPFEETINVKAGEVFSYKVKPFTKNSVYISERGNTGETEKKAIVETGKLVVQSVPIEIKISIPEIEGVKNSPKAKDKWMADNISTGEYEISFSYGQKKITKKIQIEKDKITSLFVNMLNNEFTERTEEKPPYNNRQDAVDYINDILTSQPLVYSKTFKCPNCKDRVAREKVDTSEIKYSPNSFSYSESNNTYSLTYELVKQSSRSHNNVYSDVYYNHTFDYKSIKLNGEITFKEKGACETYAVVSSSCIGFSVYVESLNSGCYFQLSSTDVIPKLKSALIFLQELE